MSEKTDKKLDKKVKLKFKKKTSEKPPRKASEKTFKENYSVFIPFVKPYWFRFFLTLAITVPIGLMSSAAAWALKPYLDVVLVEKKVGATDFIPFLIIGFSLLQTILNYIAGYLNFWVGSKITNDLSFTLFKKLLIYPVSFFDTRTSGDIMVRFAGDVGAASSGLLGNMRYFSTKFFSIVGLVGVLFYNSWQLAIVVVAILGFSLTPLRFVKKRFGTLLEEGAQIGADITTHYNESFHGNKIISSYNLQDFMSRKFRKNQIFGFNLGVKVIQKTGLITPMVQVIASIGIATAIWYGSHLVVTNQISAGGFASFLTALVMLYTPVKGIGGTYQGLYKAMFSMGRVVELLEEVPGIIDKEDAKEMPFPKDKIVYKDVSFSYDTSHPVLKNINIEIPIGKTYAFVGSSGGGKTTLVNLLPRFYEIGSGSIEIDGLDIRDMQMHSLREHIGIVFQDNFLFAGSLRANILLGSEHATQENLDQAVENACLKEFVDSLEKGLDTEIGERGVLLSGGQKQRVGIARAFLKNAPIVILDEATSALDNKSEKVVQKAIDNLMKDRTVIVIAHRLSTIRHADCILVIGDGVVLEQGSHDELMAKNGAYTSFYEASLM